MHRQLEQRVLQQVLADVQLSKHIELTLDACLAWCSELMLFTGAADSAAQERAASAWQSPSSVDSVRGIWHLP